MIRCPHKLNLRLSDKDQAWLMELLTIYRKSKGAMRTKTDMVLDALREFRDTLFMKERRFFEPPVLLPAADVNGKSHPPQNQHEAESRGMKWIPPDSRKPKEKPKGPKKPKPIRNRTKQAKTAKGGRVQTNRNV